MYLPKKQLLGTDSDTVHACTRGGVRNRYKGQETSETRVGKKILQEVTLLTSPEGGLEFRVEEKWGKRIWG